VIYAVLLLYFAVVLGIGGYVHWTKRDDTLQEYTIANRRLGWITASLSAFASAGSGLIFIGIAGMAYAFGLPMLWYATGGVIWAYITFFIIGRRLRVWSEALGTQTVTEFLGKRFQDNTVRLVASVITIVFYIAYVGSQFCASGKALVGFLGWDYTTGIWVSALILIGYTMVAGFWGVCLTDVFQGLLMILAAVIMPVMGIIAFGGIGPMFKAVAAQKASLITVTGGRSFAGFGVFLLSWIGSGLMGIGNPHIIVRTMAISDSRRMIRSGVLAVTVSVILIYGVVFIGLLGRAMFPNLPDQELVFPYLAKVFHPALAGLFFTAVISAIMSTADSQLILGATEIVCSIYTPFFARNPSDARLVRLTRICVVAIGAIALGFALSADRLVFWFVLFAWAGLGCSFGPLLLLSLFWRKMTKWGAVAGMLAGSITVFVWSHTPMLKAIIYEGVPGFVAASLAAVVLSLLTAETISQEDYSELLPGESNRSLGLSHVGGASVGQTVGMISGHKEV